MSICKKEYGDKMIKKILLFAGVIGISLFLISCKKGEDLPPVIIGAVDQTIETESYFLPLLNVTAFDDNDGNVTDKIIVTSNVNTLIVGTYQVTYTVFDSKGQMSSVTVTITVIEAE